MYIYWKPTPDNNDKAECIANDLIRYIIYFLSVYVTNQGGKYFYCIFGWFRRQKFFSGGGCGAKNFRNKNERWFCSDQIFISVRYPPLKNLTITYGYNPYYEIIVITI